MLDGYKTYLAAGLLALYAIVGGILGMIPIEEASMKLIEALGLAGIGGKLDKANAENMLRLAKGYTPEVPKG